MTVPGSNGGASAYTYAWQDPVNFVDPTGLRPVSQEEYDAIRKSEEQGSLGKAWEAIKEDPWGTVAMVGVVAVGVGLLFVPGGQVIGAGILIGAATSAGVGLATGTFDPRQVALGRRHRRDLRRRRQRLTTSTTTAIITGGALGGGERSRLSGTFRPADRLGQRRRQHLGRWCHRRRSGTHLKPYIKTGHQAVVSGAVTEGAADVHQAGAHRRRPGQLEPGRRQRRWRGGSWRNGDHHFSQDPPTLGDPSRPRLRRCTGWRRIVARHHDGVPRHEIR